MTTKFTLKFELHGFWHVSTGRGEGAILDMLTHRDTDGLPCLPGRSVKGLLRDAVCRAEAWGYLDSGTTEDWFGTLSNLQESEQQVSYLDTEAGCLLVSDAVLEPEMRNYLRYEKQNDSKYAQTLLDGFFHPLAATKMRDGVAQDKSLRSMEVVIPLDLYAELCAPADWNCELLQKCLPLIRAAGGGNNRGLGRVTVSLEEINHA